MEGLIKRLASRRTERYVIQRGVKTLDALTDKKLPNGDAVYKLISFSGGFSSINFIQWVAKYEQIIELTASTLRIGEKQFYALQKLNRADRLLSARFLYRQ